MDVFENAFFLPSLLIGATVLAGISAAWQKYSEENEGVIRPKAVLRDGILGLIFTAMAWNFIPDTMKHITEGVTTSVASATTSAVSNTASFGEYDVQIGPARF